MAGKIETVSDLLDNIEFLEADTRVRSANGNPIWVGIAKRKNHKGKTVTELVIHGELKIIEKVIKVKVYEYVDE